MTNKRLISQTLARHMLSCIHEYELIKSKSSSHFKTVKSFCEYHKFSHQNFMKVYHRYKQNPVELSLIPQKRGPKFKTRRFDLKIEEEIVSLRKLGNNRCCRSQIIRYMFFAFSTGVKALIAECGLCSL
jgi:hypothetical protein